MGVTVPVSKRVSDLHAYRTTENGVEGYTLQLGNDRVFIEEKDADTLARYFLFNPKEASVSDPQCVERRSQREP